MRVQVLPLLPKTFHGGLTLTGKGAVLKTAARNAPESSSPSSSANLQKREASPNWLWRCSANAAGVNLCEARVSPLPPDSWTRSSAEPERRSTKPKVACSNHAGFTKLLRSSQAGKAPDSESDNRGFESYLRSHAEVAQLGRRH